MWFPFAKRVATSGLCGQDGGENLMLRRQHDVGVASSFVPSDKLALQFDQFGVVIALQRLVGGNRHGSGRLLKTRRLIGSGDQGRGKCAMTGKPITSASSPGLRGVVWSVWAQRPWGPS